MWTRLQRISKRDGGMDVMVGDRAPLALAALWWAGIGAFFATALSPADGPEAAAVAAARPADSRGSARPT